MIIVDREIAQAPQDMDIRAWRARILMWSGRLPEAENDYREILANPPQDPDSWMGLANVYSLGGRWGQMEQAIAIAVQLDPNRADLHAAHGRSLGLEHKPGEARLEFQKALALDPRNEEAQAGLLSLRGGPKHELLLGTETDLFNFAGANHSEGASLLSQWTPRWKTTASGNFYRLGDTAAGKVAGSITGKTARWGSLTVGGAVGHDNGVIPKSEILVEYDQGWRLAGTTFLHGFEANYGQHWYWYSGAQILTINGTSFFYLPDDSVWSFGLTAARSDFFGTQSHWRPSGITRLTFPIIGGERPRIGGNLFFAVGTENFASVDQIGHFSSQTYGGGLQFRLTERQYVKATTGYQHRTQDRSETEFDVIYGIHF
jgi:hypothetical protein